MYPVTLTLLKRIWRSSLRGNTSSFCLLVAAADSPISRVALGGPPSPTLPLDTEPNYTRKVNRLVLDQHCWWISCHSKTSQSFGHDVTLCLLMAKSNRNVRSCCLTGTVHGTRWSLAVLSGLGFQSEWNFGKTGQRSTDWHSVCETPVIQWEPCTLCLVGPHWRIKNNWYSQNTVLHVHIYIYIIIYSTELIKNFNVCFHCHFGAALRSSWWQASPLKLQGMAA